MIRAYREWFNSRFSDSLYQRYMQTMHQGFPGAIEFRVAETPVFIGRDFRDQLLSACEAVIDIVTKESFTTLTAHAVPAHWQIPNSQPFSHFMVFDFGVCINPVSGLPEPQLIEMQGFPSLFGFQTYMANAARQAYKIPDELTTYLNGFTEESYLALLKDIIIGAHDPEEVILLDLFPHLQKTRIDFYCTQHYTGIQPVCLTDLYRQGRHLYYNKAGRPIRIQRIYNRLIFDELEQQAPEIKEKGKLLQADVDVEWIPHPDWFYRISKFTLPFLDHPNIPATSFLHEVKPIPANLKDYVLKPLFSFSGRGVEIDVTPDMIRRIADQENWILQKKVPYADIIATPDGPAKTEIRIFYFWKEGDARPVAVNNLARLSKGKMIGVSHNNRDTWVGGSLAFFEKG